MFHIHILVNVDVLHRNGCRVLIGNEGMIEFLLIFFDVFFIVFIQFSKDEEEHEEHTCKLMHRRQWQ